jgi:hypothetical protein
MCLCVPWGNGLLIDSEPMRIPIPAIVVPLIILLLCLFVPALKERRWTVLRITGAIPAVVGYSTFVTARLPLGNSFAVTPQRKELVTRGLYPRIGTPIYVFVDAMIFSLSSPFTCTGCSYVSRYWWACMRFECTGKPRSYEKSLARPTSITATKLGSEFAGSSEVLLLKSENFRIPSCQEHRESGFMKDEGYVVEFVHVPCKTGPFLSASVILQSRSSTHDQN